MISDYSSEISQFIESSKDAALEGIEAVGQFTAEKTKDAGQFIADTSKDIGVKIKTNTVKVVKFLKPYAHSTSTYKNSKDSVQAFIDETKDAFSAFDDSGKLPVAQVFERMASALSTGMQAADDLIESLMNELGNVAESLEIKIAGDTAFTSILQGITRAITNGMNDYIDGVTETSFGGMMEKSWYGSSNESFLNYFANNNANTSSESFKIKVATSTPLDPGETRASLYGTMMMGAPYLYNQNSDPTNRALINSLIKDGRFVTFIPGLPQYNGTSYTQTQNNNILYQTRNPNDMLSYLKKNGLDEDFSNKDKRYYTFKTDYEDYFAYLETMLNVIRIKMGLATDETGAVNLLSFFNIRGQEKQNINPDNYKMLKTQYKSAIGFFTNPNGSTVESVSNMMTSFGAEQAAAASSNSDEYKRLNYLTGMGTGGALKNLARKSKIAVNGATHLKDLFANVYDKTINTAASIQKTDNLALKIARGVKTVATAAMDTVNFAAGTENDPGAQIAAFTVQNGMSIKYPELWQDSDFSRSITFDFTFTSPYGDPESIFKYVYVPFCALYCLAMPRQAAENGYVSPFLVRVDCPGVVTSDLAMITSLTWTKGGSSNLWTKDGLPRQITCSVSIADLYPYLAMTKRISYLSANPSYSVFLDSLTGMLATTDGNEDDYLNTYFKNLLDRVTGASTSTVQWNKFNSTKAKAVAEMTDQIRSQMSATVDVHSIPWMHNSSI